MLPTLVLAAGLGTRLDPLTRLTAKAAMPLGSQTLIEHVLGWLRREHVRDVVVNLHHRPDTITAVIGDGSHLGLRVRYSWEQDVLGSAGGPRRALPLMAARTCLIVNSEPLVDFDLRPMLDAHTRSGAEVTLAVVPNPAPATFNGIRLGDDDRVEAFVPAGQATGTWHFVGVQIVEASVFAGLEEGVPAESVKGLYREMLALASHRIYGWRAPTRRLLHIGTPREYLDAAMSLAHDDAGHALDARSSARVRESVIWPGTRIGADVTLTSCVVAGLSEVPPRFEAEASVVLPASVVRANEQATVRGEIALFPIADG